VRVIIPKKVLRKTRFKLSPVHYKITGRDGLSYILTAADGSTMTRTRFFLVPQFSGTKFAKTISGTSRGEIDQILGYNKKTKKYKVSFKMPDGTKYYDEIPESYLRAKHPTRMSDMEKEFLGQK